MTKIKPKYVVHPGWIVSRRDGDLHYISFLNLCQLYKVSISECIDATYKRNWVGYKTEEINSFQHLRPNPSGIYLLLENRKNSHSDTQGLRGL